MKKTNKELQKQIDKLTKQKEALESELKEATNLRNTIHAQLSTKTNVTVEMDCHSDGSGSWVVITEPYNSLKPKPLMSVHLLFDADGTILEGVQVWKTPVELVEQQQIRVLSL